MSHESQSLSRRRFAESTLLGAVVASLTIVEPAAGQEPPKEPEKPPVKPARETADRLLELLQQLYPDHLTDDHLAALREKLEKQCLRSRLLSAYPLTNADEPAVTFSAYRADG